jgi:hypothetical protein
MDFSAISFPLSRHYNAPMAGASSQLAVPPPLEMDKDKVFSRNSLHQKYLAKKEDAEFKA